jgi:hypothetical protein
MDDAEIDAALATLQSRRLAPQESGLLAWARETVSYETPVIQKHTRLQARTRPARPCAATLNCA